MIKSDTQKDNLAIEASGAPSKLLYTIFAASAILGITGWIFLLTIFIFWTLESPTLPTIKEPIPVLNENNEVAVGDELIMEFEINKLVDLSPVSAARYLECESGNLVTLTAAPITLPIGSYVISSRDVTIPAKVSPGDVCVFVIQATFEINPLKQEVSRFYSERFTVTKAPESETNS